MKWPVLEWQRKDYSNSYGFEYRKGDASELESLDISCIHLKSEGETPTVAIDIPEDYAEVDIPFYMGQGLYRVTEIRVCRGTEEAVIRFKIQKEQKIPEKAVLRIDNIFKFWEQDYHFELK